MVCHANTLRMNHQKFKSKHLLKIDDHGLVTALIPGNLIMPRGYSVTNNMTRYPTQSHYLEVEPTSPTI